MGHGPTSIRSFFERSMPVDVSRTTAIGFVEDLALGPPPHQPASKDLDRWLSVETFEGCKNLFRYHLSEEEY
jgi:hypothetical protein